jgi:hypothetical protein
MVDTVKFNVGGRHFEVSRNLIEQNPDTMLAKMISETWDNEPDKPMFIDRDGDKFSLVLDYLRYGSIELPVSIPTAMFQRELDYYSITGSNGSVTQEQRKTFAEMTKEINGDFRHHDLKCKIWQLATCLSIKFHKVNLSKGKAILKGDFKDNNLTETDFVFGPGSLTVAQVKSAETMLKMFLNDFYGLQIIFNKCNASSIIYSVQSATTS